MAATISGSGTSTLIDLTTSGNTTLGDATTDTLTVGVTGIVKDASGNVGIGTSSPSRKLNLKGSDVWQKFEETAGSGRSWLIGTGSGSNFRIYDETVSLDRMAVDTSGNLQFNSGYGSVATAYGCRAWVNFNGTSTVAIRASGNVSSITDNGTGDYTVNFTTAMTDANYSTCGTSGAGATSQAVVVSPYAFSTQTTSAMRFRTFGSATTLQDQDYISIAIFR